MDAGRELDADIARRVMGWVLTRNEHGTPFGRPPGESTTDTPLPHYSTDIAAAWQVAGLLRLWVFPREGRWYAGLISAEAYIDILDVDALARFSSRAVVDGGFDVCEGAETAPLAICRAALAAVGAAYPA